MKYKIILGLLLLSLIFSIILVLYKGSALCASLEGCEIVKNSEYAYTFGVNNSYYGIIIFTFLSIITYLQITNPSNTKRIFLKVVLLIGSIIALRFIYIQAFILNAYCTSCLIIDTSVILATFVSIKKGEVKLYDK